VVGDQRVHAHLDEGPHLRGVVHRPGHDPVALGLVAAHRPRREPVRLGRDEVGHGLAVEPEVAQRDLLDPLQVGVVEARDQLAPANLRGVGAAGLQHVGVEGGDEHPILEARLAHHAGDGRGDGVGGPVAARGLDLDVDQHLAAELGEHVVQAGHALAGEGRAVPGAGVERRDGRPRGLVDEALAVGGALQAVVVDDHHLAVGAQRDVELEGHAEGGGRPEGRHRVLGGLARRAAVRDHAGTLEEIVGGARGVGHAGEHQRGGEAGQRADLRAKRRVKRRAHP
jgi:hypothetical protein